MPKLTRREIARRLEKEVGSHRDACRFVDAFFEVLGEQIAKSEQLRIHGFGVFRRLEKKARIGRNPKTGESALIAPRRAVSFIAGGKFKRLAAGHNDKGDEK